MPNEWQTLDHALNYLARADSIPHRVEGEQCVLEELPRTTRRILDLGTGDGRLLALALLARPEACGVALDYSRPMLEKAAARFASDKRVQIVEHNLDNPLPALGSFNAIISSFAIHHLEHDRKRELYQEAWALLQPGGVFCNLEHVSSPTPHLHERFYQAMKIPMTEEDPSNKLLDVETQLGWLREIGFLDVDCFWKWREMALLAGRKPEA